MPNQIHERYVHDDCPSHTFNIMLLQNSQDLSSRPYRGSRSRSCGRKVANDHDRLHAGRHEVDGPFTTARTQLKTT